MCQHLIIRCTWTPRTSHLRRQSRAWAAWAALPPRAQHRAVQRHRAGAPAGGLRWASPLFERSRPARPSPQRRRAADALRGASVGCAARRSRPRRARRRRAARRPDRGVRWRPPRRCGCRPCSPRYVTAYPDVDLVLRTGTTAELIERVLARELEGAFVCGPIVHPQLETTPFFEEELALLSAPTQRSVSGLLGRADLRCSSSARLFRSPAAGRVPGTARNCRTAPAGIRYPGGDPRCGRGRARRHVDAGRSGRTDVAWRTDCRPSAAPGRGACPDALRAPPRLAMLERARCLPGARRQGESAMMRGSTTVFTVKDVMASPAYYRDKLGFDVAFEYGSPTSTPVPAAERSPAPDLGKQRRRDNRAWRGRILSTMSMRCMLI